METPEKNAEEKVESAPSWTWITLAIVCLLIALIGWISSCKKEEKSPSTTKSSNNSNPGTPTEVLQLIEEHNISPGVEWTTPWIDYKFKLSTEGHAIDLQFSGNNGTWLKPVSYPTEGDFSAPPDARPGPVKVQAGKGETRMFRVQLYKKINIMLR